MNKTHNVISDKYELESTLKEQEKLLNNIKEFENKINEIEGIKNIKPMTHTLDDFVCTLREDIADESIPVEELLDNCDDTDDGCVSVPKVVG